MDSPGWGYVIKPNNSTKGRWLNIYPFRQIPSHFRGNRMWVSRTRFNQLFFRNLLWLMSRRWEEQMAPHKLHLIGNEKSLVCTRNRPGRQIHSHLRSCVWVGFIQLWKGMIWVVSLGKNKKSWKRVPHSGAKKFLVNTKRHLIAFYVKFAIDNKVGMYRRGGGRRRTAAGTNIPVTTKDTTPHRDSPVMPGK